MEGVACIHQITSGGTQEAADEAVDDVIFGSCQRNAFNLSSDEVGV